jgi:heat shock protein HslJ
MKFLYIFFAASFSIAACSPNKKTAATESSSAKAVENKPLEGTFWVLTELNGKAVSNAGSEKPSYIFFSAGKKRVSLSGGCNVMGGSYELLDGNRIKLDQMISTMMACPDMTNEEGLKKMAEMVDNYAIQGENLSFAKARMAPAARFKAAPIPAGMKLD